MSLLSTESLSECSEDDDGYAFWICGYGGDPYYMSDCDSSCNNCNNMTLAGDDYMAYMTPGCILDDEDEDDDDEEDYMYDAFGGNGTNFTLN